MRIKNQAAVLLCTSSLIALSSSAMAQTENTPETVTVTGSRVIGDIQNSPTPLTVVTTDQLLETTPTDIADGLNKLPDFVGSTSPRTQNNASSNAVGNTLNLRSFGAQRTLTLFDGHRSVAGAQNGTVDIDTLPQMLMSRVDVVTGGGSAVYGSDAVTGVVNFVLDKNFDGVKYKASGGIAQGGYGANQNFGVAAGTDLFGGKMHIEGSAEYQNEDPIQYLALPYGPGYYTTTGSTTNPNAPSTETVNTRYALNSNSGLVTNCGTGCAAANMQFVSSGNLGAFTQGTPTGTTNISSGGDGGYAVHTTAQAGLKDETGFARASYQLDNDTVIYLQGSAAQSKNSSTWYDTFLQSGNTPVTFFKNNAYLSAATQAQLNTGTGTTFTIGKYFPELPQNENIGIDRTLSTTVGADGQLFGKYDWDVYYTHGENRLAEDNVGNTNDQNLLAAEDAVASPTGQIVCYDTTAAAGAAANAAYAACQPINPFGPNTGSIGTYKYITQTTFFHETNKLDDLGGSVAGDVYDLPAGPVKVALSGEARWMSLLVNSPSGPPTQQVNCAGLRLCPATPPVLFSSNVLASLPLVSENVWEFAGETNVPVLKDLPLVDSFDVNLAGRYTDYSTSGTVQTWKIGLDWHINPDVRFRGTTSVDIRAPTLTDLYGPLQANIGGFTDLLTGVAANTQLQAAGGNPNLVPEVSRTWTAGVVFTPTFIPNLTFSADYYQVGLKNAIGAISGTNTVIQQLCNSSGGSSPFCALYTRPFPTTNTTAANFPTFVANESLNAAFSAIGGVDFELDYNVNLEDLFDWAGGNLSVRDLVNWQPTNESQSYPGATITYAANPVTRSTAFLNYSIGEWAVSLQDQWIAGYNKSKIFSPTYYTNPRINSFNTIDMTLTRKVTLGDGHANVFLNVQNIFNANPPLWGGLAGDPGYSYPVPNGYPILGRQFLLGIRGNL